VARTLAQTVNCAQPERAGAGQWPVEACGSCASCRKIAGDHHTDVHWVRPESKSRVIVVEQMRELMREIQLKATEAAHKVAVIVAADRLKTEAANAFLKTLEEPPPGSVLILLSTEPQRLLETIVSRCLRLNMGGGGGGRFPAETQAWVRDFAALAAGEQRSLLGRYQLVNALGRRFAEIRSRVETELAARSPLERYEDVERDLRERWEEELTAAVESEYRRERGELLQALQWWLRDVWLETHGAGEGLLNFAEDQATRQLAGRLTPRQSLENLAVLEETQRLLYSNVQEALALEVAMLKLHL
jgi:DNA polymerase-3 subunit delta'